MDPITTAIIAAVSAGAAAGTTEVGKKAILDAYNGLKNLIQRKVGTDSEVVKAITSLEGEPESQECIAVLQEKVKSAKALNDEEVIKTAKALLEMVGPKQASVSKFSQQAQTMHGPVQAEHVTLTQHFGDISSKDK
jgi:hypothetical protein